MLDSQFKSFEMKWSERNDIAFLSSFISIILALMYVMARIGFGHNTFHEIYPFVGVSFFLLFSPGLIKALSPEHSSWLLSESVFFLGGIFCVALGGYANPPFQFFLAQLFGGLGSLMFFLTLISKLFHSTEKWLLLKIFIISIFSIWLGSELWGYSYRNPLFLEGLYMGEAPRDPFFNAAMSEMIRIQKTPSLGLDGLVFMPYHFGSHWWIAQLSSLLGTTPLFFYQLGYPVIILPLFIFGLMSFSSKVRKIVAERLGGGLSHLQFGLTEWMILAITFIGLLPDDLLKHTFSQNLIINSESYVISIFFVCVLLSMGLDFSSRMEKGPIKLKPLAWIFIFLPFLLLILGLLKVSALFLLSGVGGYFFFRMRWYRIPWAWSILFLWIFLNSALAKWMGASSPLHVHPFYFVQVYYPQHLKPFYLFISFYLTLLFIFLRLFTSPLATVHDLWGAIKNHQFLDVEAIVLLSAIGMVVANTFSFPFSNGRYFSGVQHYAAMVLLIAWGPEFGSRLTKKLVNLKSLLNLKISFAVIFLSAMPFFVIVYGNADNSVTRFILKNIVFRKDVLSVAGLQEKVKNASTFKEQLEMILWEPAQHINSARMYAIAEELLDLGKLSVEQKKKTAIFIPPSNSLYWDSWNDCAGVPMVAPAMTGMPLLWGLSSHCLEKYRLFGYEHYDVPSIVNALVESNDVNLCRHAREKGFSHIIVLDYDTKANPIHRELSCNGT